MLRKLSRKKEDARVAEVEPGEEDTRVVEVEPEGRIQELSGKIIKAGLGSRSISEDINLL